MKEENFEIINRSDLPESIILALNGNSKEYNSLILAEEAERKEVMLAFVTGKTPERFIREREGRGKQTFKYVSKGYFEKALNMIFGVNGWNTEVKQVITREKKRKDKNGNMQTVIDITVIVRLEYMWGGVKNYKEQAGSAEAYEANPFGDAFKSAITDGLKKCCSQLGIAGDVYGQSEEALTGVEEAESNVTYNKKQLEAALERHEARIVEGTAKEIEILKAYNWLKTTKYNDLILRARNLLEQYRENAGTTTAA